MKKWIKLGLIIIWVIVIFMLSNQNGLKSSSTSDSFLLKVVHVLNLNKDNLKDEEIISKYTFIIRKGAHFSAYFILGILIYSFLGEFSLKKYKIVLFTILLCMCLASLDEVHQYFIPGRSARVFDVFIDVAGSCLACILIILLGCFKNKLIKRK